VNASENFAFPIWHAKIITDNEIQAVYNLHDKNPEGTVADTLEHHIGKLLRERGLKLSLAESCTGGLLGDRITNLPGSSEYFWGSLVTYAYEAKVALLHVSWDTLRSHGAVSRETVLEMARGAREALNTDIAVSVSGIAGPGGGTEEKPVGTTWTGLVAADGEWARLFRFAGDRVGNKASAADAALQLLLDYLEGRVKG
jgi:PncC family amidohydrolase